MSAFSRVNSDYWDAEVSVGAEDPLGEVVANSTGGENPAQKAERSVPTLLRRPRPPVKLSRPC